MNLIKDDDRDVGQVWARFHALKKEPISETFNGRVFSNMAFTAAHRVTNLLANLHAHLEGDAIA